MTDGENARQCAKNTQRPRNREDSKPYAPIDANQEFGPVLNIGIATVIDVLGIEVQVPSLSSPWYSVWVLLSRGHERFVNEIHRHNSDIVQDSNNAKMKFEPSSMHRENVASTMRDTQTSLKSSSGRSGGSSNPTSIHPRTKSLHVKKEIPKEDRIWTTTRRCQKYTGHSWETCISKCVTNTVRQNDQDEREAGGVMHRSVILPVLRGRFQNQLEKEFTDEDWLQCFYLGSIGTRFEICEDESGELKCIRAIQGHSGGMIISPRLMNYVMIPDKWKPFIHHVGRARDQYSLAEAGLVAGGKNDQQRCRWSRINYRCQETMESTLSNSLETWTRCSVLDPLVHSTRC